MVFSFRYSHINHADVRLVRPEPKGACFVHRCYSCYRVRGLRESWFHWESVSSLISISDLVVYSGRCCVEKKKNIWTSRQKLVALQIWVEKGKYFTLKLCSSSDNPNLSPPSEPYVSRASRRLLTLRDSHLGPHRPWSSLGRNVPLRFTCVWYDALQVYRSSSPNWGEHIGHFISRW